MSDIHEAKRFHHNNITGIYIDTLKKKSNSSITLFIVVCVCLIFGKLISAVKADGILPQYQYVVLRSCSPAFHDTYTYIKSKIQRFDCEDTVSVTCFSLLCNLN